MFIRNSEGSVGTAIAVILGVFLIFHALLYGISAGFMYLGSLTAAGDARDVANYIQQNYTWDGTAADLTRESGFGKVFTVHDVCWGTVNGSTLGPCGKSAITGASGQGFYVKVTWSTAPIGLPVFPHADHATHIARGTLQVAPSSP